MRLLPRVRCATLLLVASLCLAAPAAGQGPGQGRGPGAGRGAGPALLRDTIPQSGPIDLLLSRRDSIGLTALQVRRLEALQAELRQQNAAPIAQLVELRRGLGPLVGMHPRDMTPAQRQQFAAHAVRARPLLEQVRRNNVAAMARVGELLTPAQKRDVRGWLERSGMLEGGTPGPQHRNRRGQGRGGSGGVR